MRIHQASQPILLQQICIWCGCTLTDNRNLSLQRGDTLHYFSAGTPVAEVAGGLVVSTEAANCMPAPG